MSEINWINIKSEYPYYKGEYIFILQDAPNTFNRTMCWLGSFSGVEGDSVRLNPGGYSGDTKDHWIPHITHYVRIEFPEDI